MTYLILDEIEDKSDTNILKWIPMGIQFMNKALTSSKDAKVLVHCAAGISRSGAFILAYMIKYHKYTVKRALSEAKLARPKLFPNLNFQE
jgi:protein-tyrosine phosphatase